MAYELGVDRHAVAHFQVLPCCILAAVHKLRLSDNLHFDRLFGFGFDSNFRVGDLCDRTEYVLVISVGQEQWPERNDERQHEQGLLHRDLPPLRVGTFAFWGGVFKNSSSSCSSVRSA